MSEPKNKKLSDFCFLIEECIRLGIDEGVFDHLIDHEDPKSNVTMGELGRYGENEDYSVGMEVNGKDIKITLEEK